MKRHLGALDQKWAKPAITLILTTFLTLTAAAQTKNCQCQFDTKDYEAYGTNGACGIFMYNKAHTCEVSFAGTGGSHNILDKFLGPAAVENQYKVAPRIFEQYLVYERKGDPGQFVEASFIEASLVVLERAALFRESSASTNLPLKEIDTAFVEFSKKNSERIAAVFSGKAAPYEENGFSVGRGFVEFNFKGIATVRVVYFSEKPR